MDYSSPPIPERRASIYEFYKLTFDERGCPMKKTDKGNVFHPILAPYLICDYVLEFERSKDHKFLISAENILRRAFEHAEKKGASSVFIYKSGSGLSQHPYDFYSALTQTWYLKAICDLSKHFGDKYRDYLESIFASLLVPIDGGGVLVHKPYGWILEEYPSKPSLYTLNGWLTVLRMIISCRNILTSFSINHELLLKKNLDALEYLLPLYDAGFCRNSRYQLSGFRRLRIVFDRPVSPSVLNFSIEIPNEGEYHGNINKMTHYRWENYVERVEQRVLQFNFVQSLISFPDPNKFSCNLSVTQACKAKFFVSAGKYKPDLSAMPTEEWSQISEVILKSGRNDLVFDIPFDNSNLFAYPTNFKKKIEGLNYNVYHFVHIITLAEIFAFSKRSLFKDFALRWLNYSEEWPGCEDLSKYDVSLTPFKYGDRFKEFVLSILNKGESS